MGFNENPPRFPPKPHREKVPAADSSSRSAAVSAFASVSLATLTGVFRPLIVMFTVRDALGAGMLDGFCAPAPAPPMPKVYC